MQLVMKLLPFCQGDRHVSANMPSIAGPGSGYRCSAICLFWWLMKLLWAVCSGLMVTGMGVRNRILTNRQEVTATRRQTSLFVGEVKYVSEQVADVNAADSA